MLPLYLRKENEYPKRHFCTFKEKTNSHSDANMPLIIPESRYVHHSEWVATKNPGQNFIKNKFTNNQLCHNNFDSPTKNFNRMIASRQMTSSIGFNTEEQNTEMSHEIENFQDAYPMSRKASINQLLKDKNNEEGKPITPFQNHNKYQIMEKSKYYYHNNKRRLSTNGSLISEELSSIDKIKVDDKSTIEAPSKIGSPQFNNPESPVRQGFYNKEELKKLGRTFSTLYSTRNSINSQKAAGKQLNLEELERISGIYKISQQKYEKTLKAIDNKYMQKRTLEKIDIHEGNIYIDQYEENNKLIDKIKDLNQIEKKKFQGRIKRFQEKKYEGDWKSMWILASKEKRKQQLNWTPQWNQNIFPGKIN